MRVGVNKEDHKMIDRKYPPCIGSAPDLIFLWGVLELAEASLEAGDIRSAMRHVHNARLTLTTIMPEAEWLYVTKRRS
jgi:hypothetical protein